MTTELVVLDMAGTTIDDGQQVYRVLAQTARAHGASPSDADIALPWRSRHYVCIPRDGERVFHGIVNRDSTAR